MAQNMYRVGDFVYFEISSSAPYKVRRIEELNKTATGNVEAKVTCFCRRRELPVSMLKIADHAESKDKIVKTRRRLGVAAVPAAEESKIEKSEEVKEDDKTKICNELEENKPKDEDKCKAREMSASPKLVCVESDEIVEEKEVENKTEGEVGQEMEVETKTPSREYGVAGLPKGAECLPPEERHILRQHELFLTRQVEVLPATHIRGKCSVTLLSEVEVPGMYTDRDDVFFYSLVFDPELKTLLADKGDIRVGDKYQCVVPDDMAPDAVRDENKENGNLVIAEDESETDFAVSNTERENLVYHPHHCLTDRDIDQFLIVARAVGTFSRALDSSSSMRLPSLHMTAAAASRDVTLFHAMALLHQANYDLGQAVKYLVPPPSKQHYPLEADKTTGHNTVSLGGPILCRDQLEEWSPAEANLFEEAIERYGKDFGDIRGDYLPWKSMRDIIEYYYMWKTTNRYAEVKKSKAVEQESKLKQVYIPNYNKPNPNLVGPPNPSGQPVKGTSTCESCQIDESTQWYAWGPAHLQMRLCCDCWAQWKKYGGLKRIHDYESYDLDGATAQELINQFQSQIHKPASTPIVSLAGINRSSSVIGSVRNGLTGPAVEQISPLRLSAANPQHKLSLGSTLPSGPKTRVAFYLNTTLSMRIARRLAPKSLFNLRRAARQPFIPINGHAIKQYCTTRQSIEIIRAARQIKANKLPESILKQLAISIIASGSQLSHPSTIAVTAQKRQAGGSEKVGPPSKKQHIQHQFLQGPHSALPTTHHNHTFPIITSTQSPLHHPVVSLDATTTTKSNTFTASKESLARNYSTIAVQSGFGYQTQNHDSKPIAAVTPLSLPSSIPIVPTKAAANSALFATMPQQLQSAVTKSTAATSSAVDLLSVETLAPAVSKKVSLSAFRKRDTDSCWSVVDEKVMFMAGPKLKLLRKRLCTKRTARHVALHPCQNSEHVTKQWPNFQELFI